MLCIKKKLMKYISLTVPEIQKCGRKPARTFYKARICKRSGERRTSSSKKQGQIGKDCCSCLYESHYGDYSNCFFFCQAFILEFIFFICFIFYFYVICHYFYVLYFVSIH